MVVYVMISRLAGVLGWYIRWATSTALNLKSECEPTDGNLLAICQPWESLPHWTHTLASGGKVRVYTDILRFLGHGLHVGGIRGCDCRRPLHHWMASTFNTNCSWSILADDIGRYMAEPVFNVS